MIFSSNGEKEEMHRDRWLFVIVFVVFYHFNRIMRSLASILNDEKQWHCGCFTFFLLSVTRQRMETTRESYHQDSMDASEQSIFNWYSCFSVVSIVNFTFHRRLYSLRLHVLCLWSTFWSLFPISLKWFVVHYNKRVFTMAIFYVLTQISETISKHRNVLI